MLEKSRLQPECVATTDGEGSEEQPSLTGSTVERTLGTGCGAFKITTSERKNTHFVDSASLNGNTVICKLVSKCYSERAECVLIGEHQVDSTTETFEEHLSNTLIYLDLEVSPCCTSPHCVCTL